jgi:hypothetical protein
MSSGKSSDVVPRARYAVPSQIPYSGLLLVVLVVILPAVMCWPLRRCSLRGELGLDDHRYF